MTLARLITRSAAIAALALLCGISGSASAAAGPKLQVQVSGGPDANAEHAALSPFLKRRLEQELVSLKLTRARAGRYSLAANISKMESDRRAKRTRVSCTVAVTLMDGDSLIAVLKGNATAEGSGARSSLTRDAVGSAAHSAIAQLPNLLERIEKPQG